MTVDASTAPSIPAALEPAFPEACLEVAMEVVISSEADGTIKTSGQATESDGQLQGSSQSGPGFGTGDPGRGGSEQDLPIG